MERARATWTDERLDDLARGTERGFDRLDVRIDRLEARTDALQRLMGQLSGATIMTVLATLVSVIVTRG